MIRHMAARDLLDSSYYRPLFRLLADMDRDIAAVYEVAGQDRVSTRFVGPLITLARRGSLTVKDLAAARQVTHSAMSQTVAAMSRAGLVTLHPGADARTREVALTAAARDAMPLLMAEWRATEATVRELDKELSHPLMKAVSEATAALERVPFAERLRAHLAQNLTQDER
jgi:DNA-binding MarR family transcriptional regulator